MEVIIYGIIFVSILLLIYFVLSMRQTVIVYEEPVSWWPWTITSYNWWPYWNGSYGNSYGGGLYGGSSTNGTVHHKGPRHTPHQESRPWGGASRYANASAPSRGGHSAPSGGSHGGHGGGGHIGGSSGGHR
jgi:hypothetical protein